MEALLSEAALESGAAAISLSGLKNDDGGATLENILAETARLERLRAIALPVNLFAGVSRKRLLKCKRRIAVEDLAEIHRHPPQVRYTLLAAFCVIRAEEVTDTLVERLLTVIHKLGSRAKRRVNQEIIKGWQKAAGGAQRQGA